METHETLSPTDKICAIDLGLKDFPVVVDGMRNIQRIPHPKWLAKIEKRIKKEQRKLARKQKVSKNREKQKLKLAKLYEKLKNQERGLSTQAIQNHHQRESSGGGGGAECRRSSL